MVKISHECITPAGLKIHLKKFRDPDHVLNKRKFVLASHGQNRQVCVTWRRQSIHCIADQQVFFFNRDSHTQICTVY